MIIGGPPCQGYKNALLLKSNRQFFEFLNNAGVDQVAVVMSKMFECANHLGNVLVTISDKKIGVDVAPANGIIDYYTADVVTANDMYSGGMMMPGRIFRQAGKDYRYSINGQEKESELNENITTALYWEYDSRIGRRWNVDPKQKIWESPYLTFGGNPILYSDPNGDVFKIKYRDEKGRKRTATYDDAKGVAVNKKGMIVQGKFLDDVVSTLEKMKKVDDNGIISKVALSSEVITIKETKKYGKESFNDRTKTVLWNPNSNYVIVEHNYANSNYRNPTKDPLPAFNVLFHEIGHAYGYIFEQADFFQRKKTPARYGYKNEEEKHVIEKYEQPAAIKLGLKYRSNHDAE